MSDLFGAAGRRLLEELEIPEPWRSHVDASLVLIDDLEARIAAIVKELRRRATPSADSHDRTRAIARFMLDGGDARLFATASLRTGTRSSARASARWGAAPRDAA
jgi:hypothetical protein